MKAVLVPLIGDDRVVIVKLDHQDVKKDKQRKPQIAHIELRLFHLAAVAEDLISGVFV